MSFIKRIGSRKKSAELRADAAQARDNEEKKRAPKGSIHGLTGFKTKGEPSNGAAASSSSGSSDSTVAGPSDSTVAGPTREELRNRERRRHKDTSGLTMPSAGPSNEYPTFLVHYLGRMPTNCEYGSEAVEEPVNQLCKLREKQKLPRLMVKFSPDGLRVWEVSGPFLKSKKDGFTMSVPLHHITYGIGCNEHPNIFACIIRINADPAPGEDQMLILHAFLCVKPEVTQKLTYWQLQAYIEAYEDLKRKRILRERRRKAMAPDGEGEPSSNNNLPPPQSAGFAPVPEETQSRPSGITEVKIKGKGKVKVKTDIDTEIEPIQDGPSKAVGLILQDGTAAVPATGSDDRDDEDPSDVFVAASGAAKGTMVHRARIVSRPRVGPPSSDSSPSTASHDSNGGRSREGSFSSVEGDLKRNDSLHQRIEKMQDFMDMDANMLKKLMVTEHPTLARRIYHRAAVDKEGTFHQRLDSETESGADTVSEAAKESINESPSV